MAVILVAAEALPCGQLLIAVQGSGPSGDSFQERRVCSGAVALQETPPSKFIVLPAARVVKRSTDLVLDSTDLADLLFLTQQ